MSDSVPGISYFPPADISAPLLEAAELEHLLSYLKQSSKVDLLGYKRSSLLRRTRARMQRLCIENYHNYLAYLQQHPHEVRHRNYSA